MSSPNECPKRDPSDDIRDGVHAGVQSPKHDRDRVEAEEDGACHICWGRDRGMGRILFVNKREDVEGDGDAIG